jgi:hypothetical protein
MTYLPNEIVNIILSYRVRHPLFTMMKYLTKYCYPPLFIEHTNSYDYSFYHWYFILVQFKKQLYERRMRIKNTLNFYL